METVGSLTDKISICGLKIYHMTEQATRTDKNNDFKIECENKLRILKEQYRDLSEELEQLILDVVRGNKQIKVYHQMKMYNDKKYKK